MIMAVSTRHYLLLANLLALGLVVWSGVNLGMTILGHRLEARLEDRGPVETGRRDLVRSRPLSHYEALARHNMFGGAASEREAPAPEAPGDPPEAQGMNLRLKGTVVEDETGYRLAVMEHTGDKKQRLYRPGDDIDGLRVVQVLRDRVILNKNGRNIRLEIQQDEPAARPARRAAGQRADPSPAATSDGTLARPVGPNRYVVSRDEISRHMDDLNAVLSTMVIRPITRDGQPHGFQIAALRPGSPLSQLGIRRGDVITRVNDVAVDNTEDLINLYHQVRQLDSVMVKIERRGKSVTMAYTLR